MYDLLALLTTASMFSVTMVTSWCFFLSLTSRGFLAPQTCVITGVWVRLDTTSLRTSRPARQNQTNHRCNRTNHDWTATLQGPLVQIETTNTKPQDVLSVHQQNLRLTLRLLLTWSPSSSSEAPPLRMEPLPQTCHCSCSDDANYTSQQTMDLRITRL